MEDFFLNREVIVDHLSTLNNMMREVRRCSRESQKFSASMNKGWSTIFEDMEGLASIITHRLPEAFPYDSDL